MDVSVYRTFVNRASVLEDDDKYDLVKEMRKMHDVICYDLLEKGEKEEIGAHVAAYNRAKNEIMPQVKKGPRRVIVAQNVYDDDDRPTTHYL